MLQQNNQNREAPMEIDDDRNLRLSSTNKPMPPKDVDQHMDHDVLEEMDIDIPRDLKIDIPKHIK